MKVQEEKVLDNNDENEVSNVKEASDKDSYLNRDDFSSEHFKLEIRNLPKNFGFGEMRKFFNSLNLNFVKLKAPNKSTYCFVTFVNEQAREEAMKIINETKYKGKNLEAVVN